MVPARRELTVKWEGTEKKQGNRYTKYRAGQKVRSGFSILLQKDPNELFGQSPILLRLSDNRKKIKKRQLNPHPNINKEPAMTRSERRAVEAEK